MSKLKLLFSSLFISLGLISFSYGIVIPVNTSTTNNGSVITCDDSFNCISSFNDTSHTGLYLSSPGSYIGNVFWNTDNHLSYIFGYTSNNGLAQQIYSGNLSTTSYTGSLAYTNSVCDYLPGRGDISYDSWIENYQGLPIISYTINGYANNGCICANYGTGIDSVCFLVYGYQNRWYNSDFGITGPISLEKLDNITYGSSPFALGGSDDLPVYSDVVLIDPSLTYKTNSGVYKAFLDRGYSPGLCYGDFSTGDLVVDDTGSYVNQSAIFDQFFATDCEDSEGYCGDSVFDYYNYIGSNLSILSWLQSRYSLFKYTYEKYNISPYAGYQKGTWRIMFKVYQSNFNENFNWIDYNTFCNMTVYGFDDNSLFTGQVSAGMEDWIEFQDSKLQAILSGSADNRTGDITFENGFNQLYTRIKSLRILVDNDLVGVLPNYIILGFLLFVLLYGLKR